MGVLMFQSALRSGLSSKPKKQYFNGILIKH